MVSPSFDISIFVSSTNLDTTTLADGSYIVRVCGTSGEVNQANGVLINVVGENKPGRVTFSVTDLTVPVVGLPIVIGRTYDSLERNIKGDFGYGWSLTVGDPNLQVNPAGDVTLTLLDGRRVTFYFTPALSFLGFGPPLYTPEAGVYGSLLQSSCSAVATGGEQWGLRLLPRRKVQPRQLHLPRPLRPSLHLQPPYSHRQVQANRPSGPQRQPLKNR